MTLSGFMDTNTEVELGKKICLIKLMRRQQKHYSKLNSVRLFTPLQIVFKKAPMLLFLGALM